MAEQSFEGTVNVCAHYVRFAYWDFQAELTPDLEDRLTEEAEDRAQTCILEGYHSGDLNCLYTDDDDQQEEIRGWWDIQR